MRKKLMLILNPVSGKGQAKSALFNILSEVTEAGYDPTVYITRKKGDAERYAAESGAEYDHLICLGGDGTLSEVISGLMELEREKRPAIGYIPTGTANDVANTLKLSRMPKKAVNTALYGEKTRFDVGRMNGKYFAYIAAFGAFTEVSYSTKQENKRALGHLAYIFEGMASFPSITPVRATVKYDGEVMEGEFLFGAITNSTSVAGMLKLKERDVSLCDGYFEVILVRNPKNVIDLNTIFNAIVSRKYNNENVLLLHAKSVEITFEETVAWTRDGESGGSFRHVEAENISEAVDIMS